MREYWHYMKNEVAPEEDVYKKALDILIERWFHVFHLHIFDVARTSCIYA